MVSPLYQSFVSMIRDWIPTQYTLGGVVDYKIIYTQADRPVRGMTYTALPSFTLKQLPDAIARSPKFTLLSDEILKLLSCSI